MSMVPATAFAFIGGLVTGSFIGVVAHRVPRGRSIVGPRSDCDACGQVIAAYDNIPVLSWLVLRGRCRHCGANIPVRYLLVELAVGAAFAATTVVLYEEPAELALGLVFVALLAAVTMTDLERRVIPNAVLLAGTAAGVVVLAVTAPDSLPAHAGAALGAGLALLLVALAYPRGMGMGDVKLAAVMGLYLGRSVIPAIAVAVLVGALVGLALMARDGAAARKTAVPFGPFLALGGLVGLLAGEELIDWYLETFAGG
jgi:leader peptidase (prepilin peptidase)/N-methyltransferase